MMTVTETRSRFIDMYGEDTLTALSVIRNTQAGYEVEENFGPASLAAYKANLSRGAYKPFVSTRRDGNSIRWNDKLDLMTVI